MNLCISDNKIIDLSKIFSPSILKELISNGKSKKLTKILHELEVLPQLDLTKDVYTFFNDIYSISSNKYRNEYVYKNAIIKKILLGKHTLNTAYMINEFRVGNSKADCVIFNGTSTVYEIKSEFDTFTRLETQVNDYKKAFEFVYVVAPNESIEKLNNFLTDDSIGIKRLNKNNTISNIREAKSNKVNFDKEIIFDILQKTEYTEIVKKYYDNIPDMPNTKIYTYFKKLFCTLDINIIHNEIVEILKSRGNHSLLKEVILSVPDSLKALSLQMKLTNKEKYNLLKLLNKEIRYII